MTTQGHMAIPRTSVDRGAMQASLPATRLRMRELQSAWMRFVARHRLRRSIAHLDDRLLADIGLSRQDLGFAERLARSRVTRNGILGEQ